MHPPALESLLALLVLVPWTQEPAPKQNDTPKPSPWNLSTEEDIARMKREILGPWQLIEFINEEQKVPSGSAVGYALFLDGYMSLEAHVEASPLVNDPFIRLFQTGTHRWRFNELAELEMSSLIGTHNVTFDGIVEFEMPGTRRTFTVLLNGDQLTLERVTENGRTRLLLQRLGKLPFPDRDADVAFPKKTTPAKGEKQ